MDPIKTLVRLQKIPISSGGESHTCSACFRQMACRPPPPFRALADEKSSANNEWYQPKPLQSERYTFTSTWPCDPTGGRPWVRSVVDLAQWHETSNSVIIRRVRGSWAALCEVCFNADLNYWVGAFNWADVPAQAFNQFSRASGLDGGLLKACNTRGNVNRTWGFVSDPSPLLSRSERGRVYLV